MAVTPHFQPSLLASNAACSTTKKESRVRQSLPAMHGLSTESPVQCLLMMAGVMGTARFPTPHLQGKHLYNPTVEQMEEEATPNGCESGCGRTNYTCPSSGSGEREDDSLRL